MRNKPEKHADWKRRAVVRSLREYENNRGERWNGKKTEIGGEFGEDYILKGMQHDERRYGNSHRRSKCRPLMTMVGVYEN